MKHLMYKTIKIFIFLIVTVLTICCKQEYPPYVEQALKIAGENRKELEKTFKHYRSPKDSLKLKAAYYLVANMPGEGFRYGNIIDKYNRIFDILEGKSEEWKKSQPWFSKDIHRMLDSLAMEYGLVDTSNLKTYKDLQVLDSKYLIANIDAAFKEWQQPWCRHISFEQFCEYILPYRTFEERPEYWRHRFKKQYKHILDSVKDKNDVLEVGYHLNQAAMPYFSLGFDKFPVTIAPSNLLKGNFGNCSNNSNHKILAFRSMGVPVALDFIPIYGNNKNKHFWNSTLDNDAKPISFEKPLKDPNSEVIFLPKFTLTKIFRQTWAHQHDKLLLLTETKNKLPSNLKDTKYIDVTEEYIEVDDITIRLTNLPEGVKYAYIGVFNNAGWYPVHFGRIASDSTVVFTKMGRNVVYLPMYFKDENLFAATTPFLLNKDGEIIQFNPEGSNVKQVKLTRKYNMVKRKENWQRCLLNGKFQGANKADFSDAVTLHTIKRIPSQHLETIKIYNPGKFRYLRFLFDVDTANITGEYDGATIAEVQFYNAKQELLVGEPVTLPGQKVVVYPPSNVFDGNPLTYYLDDREEKGKYIGIDLGEGNQQRVATIRFQSRNDMNNIQPGDEYELYVWYGDNFRSLGKQVATDTVLYYNAPSNALFWLRNLSGGSEERIFTYENGKQVWW
jgi:hypothetical protein